MSVSCFSSVARPLLLKILSRRPLFKWFRKLQTRFITLSQVVKTTVLGRCWYLSTSLRYPVSDLIMRVCASSFFYICQLVRLICPMLKCEVFFFIVLQPLKYLVPHPVHYLLQVPSAHWNAAEVPALTAKYLYKCCSDLNVSCWTKMRIIF